MSRLRQDCEIILEMLRWRACLLGSRRKASGRRLRSFIGIRNFLISGSLRVRRRASVGISGLDNF